MKPNVVRCADFCRQLRADWAFHTVGIAHLDDMFLHVFAIFVDLSLSLCLHVCHVCTCMRSTVLHVYAIHIFSNCAHIQAMVGVNVSN